MTSVISSVMHVLSITCIDDGHGLAVKCVSEIPLAFVCHVVTLPVLQDRFATKQGTFDEINRVIGIMYVLLHLLLRIRVSVLLGYITIERSYLLSATPPDNIFHGRAYSSLIACKVIARASSILMVSSSSKRIC